MSERARVSLLALIAALVYANSLTNGFTLDDGGNILTNATVAAPSIKALFTPLAGTKVFRPVLFATFALNWAIGGDHPFGYHLVNVLLHVAVTLLLYLVLRKLLEGFTGAEVVAWLAALLFAVHPIHTEAVASVTGRSELLAAGFLLAAWLLHLCDWPVAALVFFALSLLSKESAVAFAPLVLVGDYVRGRWKPIHRYISIAVVSVVYFVLLWRVQGNRFGPASISELDNPLAQLPIGLRIPGAMRVAWKYLALQIFPAKLSCDYSYNAIPVGSDWWKLAVAGACGAVVLGLWMWTLATKKREWFLAGGLYLIAFATTANIVVAIGTILGERLAYLPSAGLCLLVALAWRPLLAYKSRVAWMLVVVVMIFASARTVARNHDWHDNFTLFSSDVQTQPASAKLHAMLGGQYMVRNEWERAHQELEQALHIYPDYPEVTLLCGITEVQLGRDQDALKSLNRALLLVQRGSSTYDSIAMTLMTELVKLRRHDDAVRLLDQVIENSPGFAVAWSNRAAIYFGLGKKDEARRDASTALRLDPADNIAKRVLSMLPPATAAN